MEFRDVVAARASCRQFRPDPVSPDALREMANVAAMAPSPANAQPWSFIGILDRELMQRMGDAVRDRLAERLPDPADERGARARARVEWFSTFFADAPALIAVTLAPYRAAIDVLLEGSESDLDHDEVNELRMWPDLQCIGAAVEHLLLAATDMGLGGCWVSGPLVAREEIEKLLGIEAPRRLSAMVAIGRPSVLARHDERDRKPLDEIFELRV